MKVVLNTEGNLDRHRVTLACLVLFLVSLFSYLPTTDYDFTRFDDYKIIGEHPQLYSNGSITERIVQIVHRDFPREEPLIVRDISWLVDSIIFGFERPFGYHFGNVVYHSIVVVLAFLLILKISTFSAAIIAAGIFSILASHAEPVAWIMGRKDILSAMFSLGSILLFLAFQDATDRKQKFWLFISSLAIAGLAYLSKLNSIVLPGLIFLFAIMNSKVIGLNDSGLRLILTNVPRILLFVLPFFVLALVVFYSYQSNLAAFGLLDKRLEYAAADYWRLVLFVNPLILFEYLNIIFFPWELAAYYTEPSIHSGFPAWHKIGAITIIVVIPTLLFFLWRLNRIVCLLLLCFFVALLPYANWANFGFWYANRYIYLASLFLIAALGILFLDLIKSPRHIMLKFALGILLGWSLVHNAIYRQQYIEVWRDGESLWTHETSLPSTSIHDFNNLTAVYIGYFEAAFKGKKEEWLTKAAVTNAQTFRLEIPKHEQHWLAVTHYYKGLIMAYSKEPLESQLAEFESALGYSNPFPDVLWSIGFVYLQLAQGEADTQKRINHARMSLNFFEQHFEIMETSARSTKQKQDIYRMFRAEYPELFAAKTNG
jgi:hypothetical protein